MSNRRIYQLDQTSNNLLNTHRIPIDEFNLSTGLFQTKYISGQQILNSLVVTPGGTNGQIQFNENNELAANPDFFWDNNNNKLRIGQFSDPQARLDIRAQGNLSTDNILRVRDNSDTFDLFNINGAGDVYTVRGTSLNSTVFGFNSGRNLIGNANTFIGFASGGNTTTGGGNTFIGYRSGKLTNGQANTYIGHNSGVNTGNINNTVSIGHNTLVNASDGAGSHTVVGTRSFLATTTGTRLVGLGSDVGREIITAQDLILIGANAGRFYEDAAAGSGGTLATLENLTEGSNSIMIGYNARPNNNNAINQIIIGHDATGNGNNTTTIGNSFIVRTYLMGQTFLKNLNLDVTQIPTSPVGLNQGDVWVDGDRLKILI